MLLAGSALKGFALEAEDGRFGAVSDFLFSDETWEMCWLVVDTGGWLTGRKVLIHPSAIGRVDYGRQQFLVALSKAQVKGSPDILADQPVSRQMERDLYGYYGWDPLWSGGFYGPLAMGSPLGMSPYLGGGAPLGGTDVGNRGEHWDPGGYEDPHLRSVTGMTGYHLYACDDGIGHVENLLIESAAWAIRYLVVDTRNWWSGRHVLLSPDAVTDISWLQHEMRLNVTRPGQIGPPWDPLALINDDYERQLHSHYGWRG